MTVYNVNIVALIERLREIHQSGFEFVNISIEDEDTVRLSGVQYTLRRKNKPKELPPDDGSDIYNAI
jgi:L-ribulose-5-phosphate 3-epimerase UlaE